MSSSDLSNVIAFRLVFLFIHQELGVFLRVVMIVKSSGDLFIPHS